MAVPANTFTTYTASSNAVDVNDFVTTISPMDTPLLSTLGESTANARFKENVTDALTAAAANAQAEGDAFSNTAAVARERIGNYLQIFSKTIEVSETQSMVDKYGGVSSEMPYQIIKAFKELATDVERQFIVGASASGASGTARELDGLTALASTNTASALSGTTWTATAASNLAAFEDKLNDLFDLMYETGAVAKTVLVGGNRKRRISQLTTNVTRNVDAQAKTQINSIDIYDSDFGQVDVILERYVPDTHIVAIDPEFLRTGYLRRFTQMPLAKTADSIRFAVVGELTLDYYSEKAIGKLWSNEAAA